MEPYEKVMKYNNDKQEEDRMNAAMQMDEEHNIIMTGVENYLSTGITTQRLSLDTGVSIEDLNKLLNRKKIGRLYDTAKVETSSAITALTEWLEIKTNATQTQGEFAQTPTLKAIHSVISLTHNNKLLTSITGGWGVGKSRAAQAYVQSCPRGYQKSGAIRIEFGKTDGKPTAALSKILGALHGEKGHAYRNENLHDAIGRALNPDDCLILDECNFLDDAMDVIRSIYDDFGVPIIMMGNPNLDEILWGGKSEFSALARRTQRFNFPTSTAEDVEAYLEWKRKLNGMSVSERTQFVKSSITIGTRLGPNGGLRALAQAIDMHPAAHRGALLDGAYIEEVNKNTKRVPKGVPKGVLK